MCTLDQTQLTPAIAASVICMYHGAQVRRYGPIIFKATWKQRCHNHTHSPRRLFSLSYDFIAETPTSPAAYQPGNLEKRPPRTISYFTPRLSDKDISVAITCLSMIAYRNRQQLQDWHRSCVSSPPWHYRAWRYQFHG